MKLPKNYFENLSASKYRAYLKLLPDLQKENTKAITMLIFTFIAMSFLGIFAISPTLSTIVDLHKQLEESKFVYEKLVTKRENLTSLQDQYITLSDDLPFVFDAIPQNPSPALFVGQIEGLARKQNITISSLRLDEVELSKMIKPDKDSLSFIFSLEAQGSYEQMTQFASGLITISRIITIEDVSLTKDPRSTSLILTIKGKGYFKS